MRNRWTFDPAPFLWAWVYGGGAASLAVAALTRTGPPHHDHVSTVGYVAVVVWGAPLVLLFGGALCWFALLALWDARPRRVVEPITTDIREEHRS